MSRPLNLTRPQILSFRRRVGLLDQRLPEGPQSMRRAAWAGLQDSSPRGALFSLHARVEGIHSGSWEHPSLVQLWGPRYNDYVVAAEDLAVFSLGRLPSDARGCQRAHDTADRLHQYLGGRRIPCGQAGREMGVPHNSLRYGVTTGRLLLRWDGARQPLIWTVSRPEMEPHVARLELARRYLHVFGPATAESFSRWAGVSIAAARGAFRELNGTLLRVRTPVGAAWILAEDENAFRTAQGPAAPARLLPSGDTFYLAWGQDREILVPDAARRAELWTTRVWPGAVLVNGDIAGVWRRTGVEVSISVWRKLSKAEREAVDAEASLLPLQGACRITARWIPTA